MHLFIYPVSHRGAFTLIIDFTSIFACEGMAGRLSKIQNLGLKG